MEQTTSFQGLFEHSVDPKGRVFVPKAFIEELEGKEAKVLYVTRGMDGCLWIVPTAGWQRLTSMVRAKAESSDEKRNFARLFFSLANKQMLDGTNRISLTEGQRRVAGITKNVVFAGNDDKIELWDLEQWRKTFDHGSSRFDSDAKEVLQ